MTTFSYFPRGVTPTIQIVRDGSETYRPISVNGMLAELYLDQDESEANVLIWTDEEEAIFCVHSALGEAELVKIAESLEAVPAAWHPTWLPEGYEVFDEAAGTPAYSHYVLNDKSIDLVVLESIESAAIYVTPDEGDIEKQVLVLGRPADLYLGAEGRTSALVWTDDKMGLAFTLFADPEVTEEEILRIAESVRPALTPEQPHRPSWVPAEYVRKGKSGGLKNFELHYDKENGEQILFRYWADGFGGSLPEELEEAVHSLTPENTLVNSLEAQLYADADGINHLVWHSGEDAYWLSAPLTSENLIKIAESAQREFVHGGDQDMILKRRSGEVTSRVTAAMVEEVLDRCLGWEETGFELTPTRPVEPQGRSFRSLRCSAQTEDKVLLAVELGDNAALDRVMDRQEALRVLTGWLRREVPDLAGWDSGRLDAAPKAAQPQARKHYAKLSLVYASGAAENHTTFTQEDIQVAADSIVDGAYQLVDLTHPEGYLWIRVTAGDKLDGRCTVEATKPGGPELEFYSTKMPPRQAAWLTGYPHGEYMPGGRAWAV